MQGPNALPANKPANWPPAPGEIFIPQEPVPSEAEIVDEIKACFHVWFYRERHWQTSWCGSFVAKCPTDLWVYQQIIWQCRPEVIVEAGTCHGGSALYCAMVLDRLGAGRVVTIDTVRYDDLPEHPRIKYLTGSSVDQAIVQEVTELCRGKTAMVLLDSDHSFAHVRQEIELYAPLVTKGQYLVVEDTHLNGHPTPTIGNDPGPYGAVEAWLPEHPEFVARRECEYFGLTLNPRGYLQRIA